MLEQRNSNTLVKEKQIVGITPANKRYMIFFTVAVLMLSITIIITSFIIK